MQADSYLPGYRVQPPASFLLRIGPVALLLVGLTMTGLTRADPSDNTEAAIQHLLSYVRQSGLVFVRNFNTYTSEEAARHISKKYSHFREEIVTPEDFVELCATKSLLTGKAYLVIDDQEQELTTRDWLLIELAAYRTRNGQVGE